MAKLRQLVLKQALAEPFWDAFIALDVDWRGLRDSDLWQAFALGVLTNASAVFANSKYRTSGGKCLPYDLSAVEPAMGSSMYGNLHRNCLLSVESGFGGVGIYFAEALRLSGASYSLGRWWLKRPLQLKTEHQPFNARVFRYAQSVGQPVLLDGRFKPVYFWGDERTITSPRKHLSLRGSKNN